MLTDGAGPLVGRTDVIVKGCTLQTFLGSGLHCTAYEGLRDIDSVPVVIKLFRLEDSEAVDQEQRVLDLLTSIPNIPKVACRAMAETDSKFTHALIVTPVGRPVRPVFGGELCTGAQLSKLVAVLKAAHLLDIAHRDVKPGKCINNFFLVLP